MFQPDQTILISNDIDTLFDKAGIEASLPAEVGFLIYKSNPSLRFAIRLGTNIIGKAELKTPNNGFISRHHASIYVSFDARLGILEYQIHDGTISGTNIKASSNGTAVNGNKLNAEKNEIIYLKQGDVVRFATEEFTFETYIITKDTLEQNQVFVKYDPDLTR